MELGFGQKEDFDLQTLLERSPGSSSFEDIELSDISSEGTCEVLLESLAWLTSDSLTCQISVLTNWVLSTSVS